MTALALSCGEPATVTLHIDSLAYGGRGVARHEGKVVFVKGALPGEEVVARIERDRAAYREAVAERIARPSPDRVVPRSPAFGNCNGCQWQHLRYPAQVEAKVAILADLLGRIGGLGDLPAIRAIPAATPWAYRIRARFRLDPSGAIGFCREKSHDVVDVAECAVATAGVNRGLALLRRLAGGEDGRLSRRAVEEVEITESPETGSLAFEVFARREAKRSANRAAVNRLAEALQTSPSVGWVRVAGRAGRAGRAEPPRGEPIRYRAAGLVISADPSAFLQVNPAQNERLVETVLELLDPGSGDRIVECFAGAGNFTLPLAARAGEIVAIEKDRAAATALMQNLGANRFTNVRAIVGDAGAALSRPPVTSGRVNAVLLDPPRAGAKEAIPCLLALGPSRIVYVSCNPATLARDAATLARDGYAPRDLVLVDMFPQTYHIECVARFDRAPGWR